MKKAVAVVAVLALALTAFVAVGLAIQGATPDAPGARPTPSPTTPPPATVIEAPSQELAELYSQRIDWQPCETDDDHDCGFLTVPVDYADPQGETIDLALLRIPAKGSRVGSLVVNPGGPGARGTSYAAAGRQVFREPLLDGFDVVGFDPRGVGASAPVDCLSDAELDAYLGGDPTPDTAQERSTYRTSVLSFGEKCVAGSGPVVGHVTTTEAARDMDVLRAALGEERLSYFGASYGTKLGATYAELFPQRVGRLVLDGAMPPSLTSDEITLGQAQGFEHELRAYVEDCQGGKGCPLTGDVQHGLDQITSLLDHARADPLSTGTNRRLTAQLAYTGIGQALYSTKLWATLTKGLSDAIRQGNGRVLLALADFYADRDADGTYSTNTMQAFPAISCLDLPSDASPSAMAAQAAELAKVAPTVAPYFSYGALSCKHWPVPAVDPLPSFAAEGAAPILVVGTTGDPATPYEWAQRLADDLSSGHLLTYEGNGHTAYLGGSSCVDGAVDAYLLTGELPAAGKRC
jgi:pimeloyl-ACP methyl ester carboxylesterase